MEESFEARIRGALSPYWNLVCLLEMGADKDDVMKLVKGSIKDHKQMQSVLLELLRNSEEDRTELYKLLKKENDETETGTVASTPNPEE